MLKQLTISVPVFITISGDSDVLKKHNKEILSAMINKIQLCDIGVSLRGLNIDVHEVVVTDATVMCETDI